jgi:uncharacterized membrane protein
MLKTILFVSGLTIFTAIGSVFQLWLVPYVIVVSVIAILVLVALNKISIQYYPIYLYGLALSLLWQTTMLGTHIIGVDIHSEYYVVMTTLKNGWDLDWINVGNTSVVLTVIAPFLDRLGFDTIWQFKVLYPMICAFTPVILYVSFRKMFGSKYAFISAIFFMTMPMFIMETAGIVKTQCAFVCLAGIVYFFTSDVKVWKKTLFICILAFGTIMFHYTIGIITVFILCGITLITSITNFWKLKYWFGLRTLPLKYLVIIPIVVVGFMVGWFSSIGDGGILKVSVDIFNAIGLNLGIVDKPLVTAPDLVVSENTNESDIETKLYKPEIKPNYLSKQSSLVTTAIGIDFGKVSNWGKVFRILQYLTQLMIIIGLIVVWKRRLEYKIKVEYLAGIFVCFILLLCGIFIPNFTLVTSTTTRMYMVALFFISPLIVIGTDWTFKKCLS